MPQEPGKLIAVFGAALFEEKEFNFVSALADACRERNVLLLTFAFAKDNMTDDRLAARELALVRLTEGLPLAAMVVLTETVKRDLLTERILQIGRAKNIPVFSYEKYFPGCVNIRLQYQEGFRDMVRHVIEDHGCRRLRMIAGVRGNAFSDERIDAFREVLEENGISFDEKLIDYGEFWDRPTRKVVQRMLDEGDLPEAIVCANDFMAMTTCSVLKAAGVRVPEDLIVTGFDGTLSGMINLPSISTVGPDYGQCVSFIMDRVAAESGTWREEVHEMDFRIQPRRSCGCAPAGMGLAEEKISEISESFLDTNWSVKWMNQFTSRAASIDSLGVLSDEVTKNLDLWLNPFHFAGLFSELLLDEPGSPSGRNYTTFFRHDSAEKSGLGENYSPQDLLPGFERLREHDSGIHMLLFRLLSTSEDSYGYIAEGFGTANNRDFRRCEELGMFLATAINTVLNNRRVGLLYRNLLQANKEIEQSAVRDYLTGIYNRKGFFSQIEVEVTQEANFGRYLTIFSIDMDGLKLINDHYGHKEGDFAIRAIAGAIRNFVARNGFCARYGGDEFACALVTDEVVNLSAGMVRERIDSDLARHPEVTEKEYTIGASIGSCCARIREDLDVEGMIRLADDAMYRDKQERKKNRA